MRGILIVLALTLPALAACAQATNEIWMRCASRDPEISSSACTTLIQSGQESTADLAVAHYNRGNAYLAKGLHDQAIVDYTKAIALRPDDAADAYSNRGVAHAAKRLYDEALVDYDKAIALAPDSAIAYDNRGLAYGNKGLDDEAVADFTKAIALKSDYARAYNNRGDVYEKEGLHDQAIADFTRVIMLDPDDARDYNGRARAYNGRAWALHEKGEDARGLLDAEKAVALAPTYAPGLETRAEIHEKLGHRDQALTDYRAALKLDPGMKRAQEGLKRLGGGP